MTEQELRALVREAISRHVGGGSARAADAGGVRATDAGGYRPADSGGFRLQAEGPRVAPSGRIVTDPAHAMFRLDRADGDSACLIEPAVTCNHCGYCKSYGH